MNWNQRYKDQDTPWDHGESPKELFTLLEKTDFWKGKRILVPGCGRGYDARAIGNYAEEIVGVDLSELAILEANKQTLQQNVYFQCDDFFDPAKDLGQFDLIFENTFFCAISPELRGAYAKRASELLKPNGRLVGLFFVEHEDGLEGPPWATSIGTICKTLNPYFEEEKFKKIMMFRSHKTLLVFTNKKEVN